MNNKRCLVWAGGLMALAIVAAAGASWSDSTAWAGEQPANVIGEADKEELMERFINPQFFSSAFLIVKDPSQHIDEAVKTIETAAAIYSVEFAPSGEEILTAGKDGAARLWDVDTGDEKAVFPITTHTEPRPLRIDEVHPSRPAAMAPDGTRVLTGFGDPPIRMWDVETGELVRTFSWGVDAASSVGFSGDGSKVLAVLACRDNGGGLTPTGLETGRGPRRVTGDIVAKAWDTESRELLHTSEEIRGQHYTYYRPYVQTLLSASPVADELLAGVRRLPDFFARDAYERAWSIVRWNLETGEEDFPSWPPVRNTRAFHAVYTPSGIPLFTEFGWRRNHLELWDAANEERVFVWPPDADGHGLPPDSPYLVDYGSRIYWEPPTGVSVSPCETHIVMASGPKHPARLWNMETGELVRSFTGHEKGPSSVAFSPCGDYVLTGSWDGTARLWESGIDEE